jgi:N-acetylglucosaminyl-diphospho-decaprenol L-rhamnosyltransferase
VTPAAGIDIVIVSHRSRLLLRSCLESLRRFAPIRGARIFVVDNASDDGTVETLRSEFPEVELIANKQNVGFSAANNAAIKRGHAPYVLALNPDTRVTAGALDRLAQFMDEHHQIGICGCQLVREDGSFDHAAKRSFPTLAGAAGHFLGVGRAARAPRALAQYRAPDVVAGPVDAVNGAFMLMRRSAFEEVGGFDEGYWMYMEDLDLCFRFREAGWTTWYEPSVVVSHVKAGSTGPVRSVKLNYAFHYGMYRFYRKHNAPNSPRILNAFVYVAIFGKLLVSLAHAALSRQRS